MYMVIYSWLSCPNVPVDYKGGVAIETYTKCISNDFKVKL